MERPLVDKLYLLEKTPGKGGWTYTVIPEIPQDKHSPFGWVKVKGSIDGVEFKKHHLMPMGNGMLGLSVKSEIIRRLKRKRGIMYTSFCILMTRGWKFLRTCWCACRMNRKRCVSLIR